MKAPVAVKVQHVDSGCSLFMEWHAYHELRKCGESAPASLTPLRVLLRRTPYAADVGRVLWYEKVKKYEVMVLRRLGHNLEQLRRQCADQRFHEHDVTRLALQMVSIIRRCC